VWAGEVAGVSVDDVVDQVPAFLVEVAGEPPPSVETASEVEPGSRLLLLGV
jgi:hypothetical protein